MTLPYLSTDQLSAMSLLNASTEQRWTAVRRLVDAESVGPVPDAWSTGPLQAWCWLVLVVNGLAPGDVPHPLTHWGVDLGFASEAVRRFVWFLG